MVPPAVCTKSLGMLSNEDYHLHPAVSASHLHYIAQSPFHYWSRFINPDRNPVEPTAAMRLGSLVHCAVLEPDQLQYRYSRCASRATKAGKEQAFNLASRGIEAVSDADWELAIAMNNAVNLHPAARKLLQEGEAEQSYFWEDSRTGLQCKCRPDWLNGSTIVDLKTTQDASPKGFAKSVANFRYHVQASHYLSAGFADRFVFIAVEKTYPHAVAVYELDAVALNLGESLRLDNISRIAECRALNKWPSYSDNELTLSLPVWATYLSPEDF